MSKIFYEETHNKLRKLFSGIKKTNKGEMELERIGGKIDKHEFINHPFVRKYSSMRSFSLEMVKLITSLRKNIKSTSLENDPKSEAIYKSVGEMWGLISQIFLHKLK